MTEIILPVIALGGLGVVFGALLGIAAKVFKVEEDERIRQITELLPGANCGGCGFAGCMVFAEAIVEKHANPCRCSVLKAEQASQIADLAGVKAEPTEKKVAKVMCGGTCEMTSKRYQYAGIQDCLAAYKCGGGEKSCSYGCLGYGSCTAACPFGSISICDGVAVVDTMTCHGCGVCLSVCPKHLIELVPVTHRVVVGCKSLDQGVDMKQTCRIGCIGCKICEKNCPRGAITVQNHLAVIDYSRCDSCGICAEKCPRHSIICS